MRSGVFLILFVCITAPVARAAEKATLKVRVIDADSGALLPARLSLRASDGSYPGDRLRLIAKEWPGLEAHAVFVPGEGRFELPPGETSILAARGPDYGTDLQQVVLEAGKTTNLDLKLHQVINVHQLGWVCGDAHVHMIHGEMQRPTSYEDVAVTCRAMGLDWVGVNQEYVGAGEGDLGTLKAACEKVSSDEFRLFIGGERPKSLLGHNALIGVDNPFIIPDDPPYHRAARMIHAAGGVLFAVHPVRNFPQKKYLGKWLDFPGVNLARELVFDAFCGPSFDGLSVLSDDPDDKTAQALWFNLLNRSLFVPVFADSDACFDRPVFSNHPPGFWRTYLHTGGKIEPAALAEAVRQGRTMASTGPLVFFEIDGQLSGSTFAPDGARHRVRIEVVHPHHNWTLQSPAPGAAGFKVELIRNGEVVKAWQSRGVRATLTSEISEKEQAWYAVRVHGFDPRFQVALASPIYFRTQPAARKQKTFTTSVRGHIYEFHTGKEREGEVTVKRGEQVLKRFSAAGQFRVKMPLDATISVAAAGERPVTHDLLLDYAPVHHFLWYLRSADLGDPKTFDRFEALVREPELEFPLGYAMPGCYTLDNHVATFDGIKVLGGPELAGERPVEVAAVLLDACELGPHDSINVAAIFSPAANASGPDMRLVAEGRAYDPRHPSGFNPLKMFGSIEAQWSQAREIGNGYRIISGRLSLPEWIETGPAGAIEINVRSRGVDGRDFSYIGLRVPLDKTEHRLSVCTPWPTIPFAWPDHNYGVGPLFLCGKNGREGQPKADYRKLHLLVKTAEGEIDLLPARDGQGCADADDAIFTGHFFDQVLNDESKLAAPEAIRPQPTVQWRDMPIVDATDPKN